MTSVEHADLIVERVHRALENDLTGYVVGPRGGLYVLFGPVTFSRERVPGHRPRRGRHKDVLFHGDRQGRYVRRMRGGSGSNGAAR